MINSLKMKVMLFGDGSEKVKIKTDGRVIENVCSYKYLGIVLDSELDFRQQVDYAICKAKRAYAKVCALIDGRRGLPVRIGINSYKALVRPHMEYAIPVWACIKDTNLQKLEQVQQQCIRRIVGAKAHSSSAGIEVISGVCPIGIRKRELCCREFIRIISLGENHPIVKLLNCTVRRNEVLPSRIYLSDEQGIRT